MMRLGIKLIYLILSFWFVCASANARELLIYHDADYTGHKQSAQSMAMGFNTALAEIDHQIQGYSIKLLEKDHRGNVKRSLLNMRQFLKDADALAVLGGLHSPPYLSNLAEINEEEILLLVPWAAAGPITRYSNGTNWVFRLSIDDSKAGYRLAQFAVDNKQCQSPHLLLENTGWGKSNFRTLTKAFNASQGIEPKVTWFEWNTKENVARIALRKIFQENTDCILFVGNAIEGEVFTKAMASMTTEKPIPFISHWGITGGNFHEVYVQHLHETLDLSFIQSCFSFISSPPNALSSKVLNAAYALYPDQLKKPEDIPAPPGFIHAYDLGKIFIAALNSVKLTGKVKQDRKLIRTALESLNQPIPGLIKTYDPAFSAWSENHNDAHEALNLEDFCMAHYDKAGYVHVIPNPEGKSFKNTAHSATTTTEQ